MTPPSPRLPARTGGERGVALALVLFLTILLSGLGIGLIYEGMAARKSLDRHEQNLRSLEIAEAGIVQAEMEVRTQTDYGTDGIGSVAGAYGNGTYQVTAASDPVSPDRFVLTARANYLNSTRIFEVGVRRRVSGMFQESLYSLETLTLASATTDAYDSRTGTYASQAVNSDAYGPYAQTGGSVGSNQDIVLDGSDIIVRGNAIPGPLMQVVKAGSPTVTGDQFPRQVAYEFPPAPQSEFVTAMNNNNNLAITATSGDGSTGGGKKSSPYNPSTMTLSATANSTVTMPGGVYFFRRIDLNAESRLQVTGPARIYVTEAIDVKSGSSILADRPGDVQIVVHPYPLPGGVAPSSAIVKINGESTISMALYAPGADLALGGGNTFYGSALARRIDMQGANAFHYDKALGDQGLISVPTLERLYWREVTRPKR